MRLEDCWPEDERAPRENMIARLERFPAGFIVGELEGRMITTVTSCPIHYDPAHPENLASWDAVTNYGCLPEPAAYAGANALYLVSGVIETSFRKGGVFEKMILAMIDVARRLGYRYVVAGAVLPGYDNYCRKHGEVPAEDYVFHKVGTRFVDPFMEMYRRIGFSVPNAGHVKASYYPDGPSRHYAALVVREITD
jgi:hypothetical protein